MEPGRSSRLCVILARTSVSTIATVGEHDVRVAGFEGLDPRSAYRLWQLRQDVFVVEQECPYADLDGRDLEPGTRHLWVDDESEPVGYLRMLEDGDGWRIGRVLVARSHRGRGIAEALVRAALEVGGPGPYRLDAQSYLTGWYARFGFEPSGPEFVEDGIPHVPMRRG